MKFFIFYVPNFSTNEKKTFENYPLTSKLNIAFISLFNNINLVCINLCIEI